MACHKRITETATLKGNAMLYRLSLKFRLIFADRYEASTIRRALRAETRAACRRAYR